MGSRCYTSAQRWWFRRAARRSSRRAMASHPAAAGDTGDTVRLGDQRGRPAPWQLSAASRRANLGPDRPISRRCCSSIGEDPGPRGVDRHYGAARRRGGAGLGAARWSAPQSNRDRRLPGVAAGLMGRLGDCRSAGDRVHDLRQIDVLGVERLEYELSADTIGLGLDAALPHVMELKAKVGEFGRGERTRGRSNKRTGGAIRGGLRPPPPQKHRMRHRRIATGPLTIEHHQSGSTRRQHQALIGASGRRTGRTQPTVTGAVI
jgi:hypothetical protein